MKKAISLTQHRHILELSVTKPAVKEMAIRHVADSFVIPEWMIEEWREQWDFTIPNTTFPLDRGPA